MSQGYLFLHKILWNFPQLKPVSVEVFFCGRSSTEKHEEILLGGTTDRGFSPVLFPIPLKQIEIRQSSVSAYLDIWVDLQQAATNGKTQKTPIISLLAVAPVFQEDTGFTYCDDYKMAHMKAASEKDVKLLEECGIPRQEYYGTIDYSFHKAQRPQAEIPVRSIVVDTSDEETDKEVVKSPQIPEFPQNEVLTLSSSDSGEFRGD